MPQTDISPAPWTAAADPRRRVGHAIEFHPEIGSTNDRARELLETDGAGIAVVTDLQTAGRGRRGRTWVSPAGTNLMCSVGLRPRLAARDAGWLGVAAALAVREAAAPWATLSVRWPNDLVTADGLKVAGLLLETAIVGDEVGQVIMGAGINANWPRSAMPADLRDTATSLAEVAGRHVERVELLERLLVALDGELDALEAGHSPVERLRGASWLDGRSLAVDTGDATLLGRGAGIGDDASLLLDTADGRVALSHAEVVRVVPA